MRRPRLDRRRALSLLAAAVAAPSLAASRPPVAGGPDRKAPYFNAALPVEERTRDLLARMSLEEKVWQMIGIWGSKSELLGGMTFDARKASRNFPHGFGQITRGSDRRGGPAVPAVAGGTAARWRTPADAVHFVNDVQRWSRESTRLGIPVLVHEESLHGLMAPDATMFPQALALAGSFDTDLMREVQSVIARETRARGVHLVLSPVVDIVRDPRWGRIEETFGEDPHLVTEMGVAAVEGLQGPGRPATLPRDKVFATLKHMTGHGQPESGNNISPAPIARRELRENFLPPFREVVRRTDISAVMPSYNEIDGIPSHANPWLLRDVLRGEWGFTGMVVSDYNAVEELATLHQVVPDLDSAARLALASGVDVELPDGLTFRSLVAQVRAGTVPEAQVDAACAHVLRFKFRAGL
ncbi:MAG: hypothetical protein RL030_1529, partial [Pseudomonadota bacterium]